MPEITDKQLEEYRALQAQAQLDRAELESSARPNTEKTLRTGSGALKAKAGDWLH